MGRIHSHIDDLFLESEIRHSAGTSLIQLGGMFHLIQLAFQSYVPLKDP